MKNYKTSTARKELEATHLFARKMLADAIHRDKPNSVIQGYLILVDITRQQLVAHKNADSVLRPPAHATRSHLQR